MRFASWLSALWLATLASCATKLDDTKDPEVKSIALRTHTLTQPYLDSDMQSRWYDFGGDTIVRTDSYIRLTSNQPSQQGWLWSRVPLTATNWEVEVEFKIHGKHQLWGDGLAMWISKQRTQIGPVFGSADNFEGLGIFIDTYKNNRPGIVFPMVMAMFGDGKTSYDKDNDGKETELASCSARGIRHSSVPTLLRLTYFQDKSLKLDLQYKNEGEWTNCFETKEPPPIPQIAYLGFSAETGELSDNHDIISIRARNLYQSPSASKGDGSGSGRSKKKLLKGKNKGGSGSGGDGGSWFSFLMKILLFLIVVGGAYVGWTAYRANSKRTHRF